MGLPLATSTWDWQQPNTATAGNTVDTVSSDPFCSGVSYSLGQVQTYGSPTGHFNGVWQQPLLATEPEYTQERLDHRAAPTASRGRPTGCLPGKKGTQQGSLLDDMLSTVVSSEHHAADDRWLDNAGHCAGHSPAGADNNHNPWGHQAILPFGVFSAPLDLQASSGYWVSICMHTSTTS